MSAKARTSVTRWRIATSAFSVFFTQSPSFLAYQKTMPQNKGRSNAQTLFEMEQIPVTGKTICNGAVRIALM